MKLATCIIANHCYIIQNLIDRKAEFAFQSIEDLTDSAIKTLVNSINHGTTQLRCYGIRKAILENRVYEISEDEFRIRSIK